jgi:hypothetical protein
MADITIGAAEQQISGLPKAVAGLEQSIASIFHSAVGVGEDALSALGLKHALGVVEKVATGTTATLDKIATTTENAAPEALAVQGIAQALTPSAVAAALIPHSGAVLTEMTKALAVVNSAAQGTLDPTTISVVHHNFSLIHEIHTALQGVESAVGIAGAVPIVQNLGMWGLNIGMLNGFLHWLEPEFAKLDPAKA